MAILLALGASAPFASAAPAHARHARHSSCRARAHRRAVHAPRGARRNCARRGAGHSHRPGGPLAAGAPLSPASDVWAGAAAEAGAGAQGSNPQGQPSGTGAGVGPGETPTAGEAAPGETPAAGEAAPGEATAPGEAGTPGAGAGGSGGEGTTEGETGGNPEAATESTTHFRFFAPTSFWNQSVTTSAALDPSSGAVVGALDAKVTEEEQLKHGPWINTTSYSVPIYTVPATQPTVKVTLSSTYTAPALQSAWSAVPLPPKAHPADGTDHALVVWQPSTDRLWEFWRLAHTTSGWQAAWGGAMQNASLDPGVYEPEVWPGAMSWWGSSASSLAIAGGLITLEDLQRGQINHALAMAVPNVRAGVYSSPAQRDDGKAAEPVALPEGAHLRLDPNLDLAALHLPHLTLMIAEAAQRYGIFVRDHGGNVCLFAEDPTPTGTEPYGGPSGYFEGKYPAQLLAVFPWSHLQLLQMQLHSSS